MLFCQTCQAKLQGKQTKFCSTQCKQKSINVKHQNYQSQQLRGHKRKNDVIDSMGGKCANCGYDKNYAALCFHHIDPSIKDISLTIREFSNNSIEKLQSEIGKCILMCHNCHMETHYPHFSKLIGTPGGI